MSTRSPGSWSLYFRASRARRPDLRRSGSFRRRSGRAASIGSPSSAHGSSAAARSGALSRPSGTGLTGSGGSGSSLARPGRSLPNVEIAALAGRNRIAATQTARDLGIPTAYTGENAAIDLIDASDLDVVAITSPP